MNRRRFLKTAGVGAGAFVVAGCGLSGWRAHRAGLLVPDGSPFEPWTALEAARPYDRGALGAAAILASNPHNTQPWKIEVREDTFTLHADVERHLGAFDPFRREMWLGLGCAIANAEIAAPAFGLRTSEPAVLSGTGGSGSVRISIQEQSVDPHPLYTALPNRRTNRAGYLRENVSQETLAEVLHDAGGVDGAHVILMDQSSDRASRFAEATLQGTTAINADKEMSHDGHVWFRGTARKVAQHRDGVSVPTAGLSPLISVMGQVLPEADAETSGGYWLASTERQVTETGGFGLIIVDDLVDRPGQIAAGRLWQRLHLALTKAGLAAQPLNQLPELVDRDRQLGIDRGWADTLGAITGTKEKATFAFRFGFPITTVPHSARRPLDWVMV